MSVKPALIKIGVSVAGAALVLGLGAPPATAAATTKKDKSGDVKVVGKVPKSQRPDIKKVSVAWAKKTTVHYGIHRTNVTVKVDLAKGVPQTISHRVWLSLRTKGITGSYAIGAGSNTAGEYQGTNLYRKEGKVWVATECTVLSTHLVTRNYRTNGYSYEFDSDCIKSIAGKAPKTIAVKATVQHIKKANKRYTLDTAGWTKAVKRG